jgi:hypothetical protein
MELIFKILCGILYLIGMGFGYNYTEISVYICIYGCPIICIFTALLINISCIWSLIKRITFFKGFNLILSFLYTSLHFVVFARICEYYNVKTATNTQIFNQCVADFQNLAQICGTTYEHCNIVIYVYFFFTILFINLLIGYIIKKL